MAVERRIRIGDWLVPYDDAKHEVVLKRKIIDVLKATPGSDGDCMNSRCIMAQRNAHVFPHPVLIVSTIETRVYIVDKLHDDGEPSHAIRYELSEKDSALIKAHDRYGAGVGGELRLRVPKDPKGSPKRAASRGDRYASNGGKRAKGNGKATRNARPVTSHSIGAKRRYRVAVGALKDQDPPKS
jgi:hypothetical protein